ncbi:MAG: ABC transporter ATP-binding protein [Desulfamplus sp.]|nr:ABC transporter ATP-binding protein [Desulfamplus sp.]MBF0211139.1 ABC transporter ATP-binding protein [Desulfamplus sp.]MBF0242220.1 ABC transporter ATP-binding protein [Desulfamplus sp.]MBF0390354.1 ABC transporter ATP-binding protein [Desulfamplus sp.]
MLTVKSLESGYGKIKALFGIDLEIKQGEIVALIGANGAGKTTFLKTVSGLIKPSGGNITFEGKRLDNLPPETIVNLGISHVPEGRMIFTQQSVETNLEIGAFGRKDKKEIKQDMQKYYDMFPILGNRRKQKAGTLSGGEQQMLAIARGLMKRPKLIFLDEPSMGLAPVLVNQIFKIIKELHQTGLSVLLVEQNVKKALKITQRAYVIELGKIVHNGKSSELLNSEAIRKSYLGEA